MTTPIKSGSAPSTTISTIAAAPAVINQTTSAVANAAISASVNSAANNQLAPVRVNKNEADIKLLQEFDQLMTAIPPLASEEEVKTLKSTHQTLIDQHDRLSVLFINLRTESKNLLSQSQNEERSTHLTNFKRELTNPPAAVLNSTYALDIELYTYYEGIVKTEAKLNQISRLLSDVDNGDFSGGLIFGFISQWTKEISDKYLLIENGLTQIQTNLKKEKEHLSKFVSNYSDWFSKRHQLLKDSSAVDGNIESFEKEISVFHSHIGSHISAIEAIYKTALSENQTLPSLARTSFIEKLNAIWEEVAVARDTANKIFNESKKVRSEKVNEDVKKKLKAFNISIMDLEMTVNKIRIRIPLLMSDYQKTLEKEVQEKQKLSTTIFEEARNGLLIITKAQEEARKLMLNEIAASTQQMHLRGVPTLSSGLDVEKSNKKRKLLERFISFSKKESSCLENLVRNALSFEKAEFTGVFSSSTRNLLKLQQIGEGQTQIQRLLEPAKHIIKGVNEALNQLKKDFEGLDKAKEVVKSSVITVSSATAASSASATAVPLTAAKISDSEMTRKEIEADRKIFEDLVVLIEGSNFSDAVEVDIAGSITHDKQSQNVTIAYMRLVDKIILSQFKTSKCKKKIEENESILNEIQALIQEGTAQKAKRTIQLSKEKLKAVILRLNKLEHAFLEINKIVKNARAYRVKELDFSLIAESTVKRLTLLNEKLARPFEILDSQLDEMIQASEESHKEILSIESTQVKNSHLYRKLLDNRKAEINENREAIMQLNTRVTFQHQIIQRFYQIFHSTESTNLLARLVNRPQKIYEILERFEGYFQPFMNNSPASQEVGFNAETMLNRYKNEVETAKKLREDADFYKLDFYYKTIVEMLSKFRLKLKKENDDLIEQLQKFQQKVENVSKAEAAISAKEESLKEEEDIKKFKAHKDKYNAFLLEVNLQMKSMNYAQFNAFTTSVLDSLRVTDFTKIGETDEENNRIYEEFTKIFANLEVAKKKIKEIRGKFDLMCQQLAIMEDEIVRYNSPVTTLITSFK